ncbi:hypothetical protein C3F00_040060, partial [Pseudomonas sp. MWU13-2860]
MLWWARLVQSHGGLLGAGLAGGLLAVAATLRASRVRRALLARLWTLPKLRDVAQLFVLARFYRSAGLLSDGGTPALQAFELSGRLLPAAHGQRLSRALEELRAGKPVAATLARLAEPGSGDYLALAIGLALMSGLMLAVLGLLRLGFIADLLSEPVLAAFTSASALLIVLSQLGPLLG